MSKGFLLFVNLQEMFSEVLKMNQNGEFPFELKDSYILVLSRDIITDTIKKSDFNIGGSHNYQSKYSNVDFIYELLPTATQMEYATTAGMETFIEEYTSRLYGEKQMIDIISICEVVAVRDKPVFVLSTSMEYRCGYPEILKDFFRDEMGLIGYTMDDLRGKSIDTVFNIGDVEEIKKSIESHKDMVLKQYDKEYFFNTLMDDMEKAYKEILDKKSIDDLKGIAKSRRIFISRRDDKDRIIEKIIEDITIAE